MTRMNERGLGRGLGALIPQAPFSQGLHEVPIDRIKANPRQPRSHVDPAALQELAASIREHGVLQPVILSKQPDGSYQLVAGERRWRAAQLASLPTVPAVIKEASPRASLEIALVENIQRRDLNALEEALAFKQLIEEHELTQAAVAQRVGKSRVAITNTLRLLQLPDIVQRALAEGAITEGHARAILAAETEQARLALLERVIAQELSVRATEALARQPQAEAEPEREASERAARPADPDTARLEDAFRQALGTRVQLVRGRRGGRLVIHFFSDDELQGLYDTIVRE